MGMRMPNGYGSVIRLSGRRRKPYAVRITIGMSLVEQGEGEYRAHQSYKYLEYFEKRSDAIRYLSNYNAGMRVTEHRSLYETPTFAEIYEKVIEEREKSRKGMKSSLKSSYNAAYKKFSGIHDMRISNVRYADVQNAVDDQREMSKSTVNNMILVAHAIAAYAMKYEYISNDFSAHLTANYREEEQIHKPFTAEEIEILKKDASETAALFALITICTGMRPSELLDATVTEDDLSRHYLIGGLKTDAGKNRVIPFHPFIEPFLAERVLETNSGRLFRRMSLASFRSRYWDPYMQSVGMDHLPHDGRHTCATLMEKAKVPLNRRKLILGHKVTDITEGVYTHVAPEALIEEISKMEV